MRFPGFAAIATLLAIASVPAGADEASVKRTIEARFGGIRVDSVTRTPYAGLYEVYLNGEIIYTDDRVNYIFNGQIVDARSRRNLTEERLQKLNIVNFSELPLELAIKQVRGSGKRVVAVFSDPFCPFCKRLDQALMQLDDVTIYTFLYPILRENESPQMATRIWCSADRAKAYYDFMLNGRTPAAAGSCTAPVDRWIALGKKLAVAATPVSVVQSGQRVVGARIDELKKLLDDAAR